MNASLPASALTLQSLPIRRVAPSPSNPRKRFDAAYLDELATSIREHGLVQPITVRPLPLDRLFDYNRKNPDAEPEATPQYEIVVGECRWRAAGRAGLIDIAAFVRDLDDKQVLEIQVIENLQRRDVHPLEEADGYRQLIDRHGYHAEDLAHKIGKSRSYVFGRLKLTELGELGRDMFYASGIDFSVALMIARLPVTDQNNTLKQLKQAGSAGEPISVRDAKWRIRNGFTINLTEATFPLDDASLVKSAGSCVDCPKRSGNEPEMYPDIEREDVCTDPRCFEEKRVTRREQLLDVYRAKNIPVYVDDDAKMIAPGGNSWSIDSDRWQRLSDYVPDDPQERTFAEFLGEQAPVSAVVEVGSGVGSKLLELVETTALAEALDKAGWKPDSTPANDKPFGGGQTAVQRQREQLRQGLDAEHARCQALRDRIVDRLSEDRTGGMDIRTILSAILVANIRQDCDRVEEIFIALEKFGIVMPEEYDEAEEIEKLVPIISGWPLGKMLALMAWNSVIDETHLYNSFGTPEFPPTPSLDALARAVGLPDDSDEAPPPANAAQAGDSLRDEDENLPTTAAQAPGSPAAETPKIETKEKPKGRSKAKAQAVA